jgi:hypothetical protein
MSYAPAVNLGPPQHYPLDNTTARAVCNPLAAPAAAAWSAAQSVAAYCPVGVKAVLADIILDATSVAAGAVALDVHFSSNNTTTPTYQTAHPFVTNMALATAIAEQIRSDGERVVPVNASGQFYVYCSAKTNCTGNIYVILKGYYMGG